MKRILIVEGGPRRAMNTAALCDAFEEGARAASPDIDIVRIRRYDLPPFCGCVSCLACKLKGRETGLCAVRDSLSDALRAANEAAASSSPRPSTSANGLPSRGPFWSGWSFRGSPTRTSPAPRRKRCPSRSSTR